VPSEYKNDPDLYWAIQASLTEQPDLDIMVSSTQINQATATPTRLNKTPSTADNGSFIEAASQKQQASEEPPVAQQLEALNPEQKKA
jgi:hypothetical protein